MNQRIVADTSPLKHLPETMDRRQVLYFDGLRLSAEMVDYSYYDLTGWLREVTAAFPNSADHRAPKALLGAYGVLDSANRFRSMLQLAPGVKHTSDWHLFMRSTKDVENLRNIIQHINHEMQRIDKLEASALGFVAWSTHSPDPRYAAIGWVLAAGSLYPQQKIVGPGLDRMKILPEGVIDDIMLVTADISVNLTQLRARVKSFVQALEDSLGPQFIGQKSLGTDIMISLQVPVLREAKATKAEDEMSS